MTVLIPIPPNTIGIVLVLLHPYITVFLDRYVPK